MIDWRRVAGGGRCDHRNTPPATSRPTPRGAGILRAQVNEETAMARGRLQAFNFQNWIEAHRHLLKPPVGNKKVFEEGAMTGQRGGGPNGRTEPHDQPVEGV